MSIELPITESFMITVLAGGSAVLAMVLTCALKSRCIRIKVCCIECDRSVLTANDLATVSIDTTPNV